MALVILPLLLLAGIGVRGLQMSRHAAWEGAREEAERAVRRATQLIDPATTALRGVPPPRLYPVVPPPAPPSHAQEIYEQALHADSASALPLLEQIAERHPDDFTASGLPLLPLVEWRRLQLAVGAAALTRQAELLAHAAVETHPSVLTPELLKRAELLLRQQGAEASGIQPWRKRWEEDERARTAFRQNEAALTPARASSWVQATDGPWWAERTGPEGAWRLFPKTRLVAIAEAVREEVKGMFPDYLNIEIALGQMPLVEKHAGEPLARMEHGGFIITGVLRDPAKLYAEQRKQTLWLAALLGCAVMAALGVTWMMASALARERRLNELKSDFVSSVSHELRAPVASIRIMAENLGSGIVSDESRRREYHQLIADECWRLSTLIENVLDLARIERHRKTYRFAESDVAALVQDAVQLLQPRAAQRQQKIRIEIPEPIEPPPVCDSLAVQQALINLLDNAIKFSPEKALITVRLAMHDAGQWELSVADQGPGVPKEEQANVFERFYRLGSELQRETQGTGIGLSIVRHIAEGHGGRVTVENQPEGGAKFSLILPCVPPGVQPEPALSWPAS